jgi:hypothetical protein
LLIPLHFSPEFGEPDNGTLRNSTAYIRYVAIIPVVINQFVYFYYYFCLYFDHFYLILFLLVYFILFYFFYLFIFMFYSLASWWLHEGGLWLRHGPDRPRPRWGDHCTLHCGSLAPVPLPLHISVLPAAPGSVPMGFQAVHTPLGPVVTYPDSGGPPALMSALDGLFPPDDLWAGDLPALLDPNWECASAYLFSIYPC